MFETLIGLVLVQVVTQVISHFSNRKATRKLNDRLTHAEVNRAGARQETAHYIRELQESIDAAAAKMPQKRTRKAQVAQ